MAIAAGGKTIVFTKSGAKVTDKKTGSTSTYKKTSKGFVRTSSSSGGGSQSVVEPKVLLTEKPTIVQKAKLEVTKRRIDEPMASFEKKDILEAAKIRYAIKEQEKAGGEIRPAEEETIRTKIRRAVTPLKDRTKENPIIRFVKGFSKPLAELITQQPNPAGMGIQSLLRKNQTDLIRAVQRVENKELANVTANEIGTALGRSIQSTDPYNKGAVAFTFLTIIANPTKTPISPTLPNTFSRLRNSIKRDITEIIPIRRTAGKSKKQIRLENELKKSTDDSIKKLDEITKEINKNPTTPAQKKQQVETLTTKLNDFKKSNNKRKKKYQQLSDETKAKKLGELFKAEKVNPPSVKKSLPKDKKSLTKLVEDAEKVGGNEVSKLKKRIEKELGLKLKIFKRQVLDKRGNPIKIKVLNVKTGKATTKNKVKTSIKFLEPKKPKGKGKKEKKKVTLVKVEGKRTGVFRLDKKAQIQKQRIRKRIATVKQNISGFKRDVKDIRQAYREYRIVKRQGRQPKQSKAQLDSRKVKTNRKIKNERTQLKKDIQKLRSLKALAPIFASQFKQAQKLDLSLSNLNKNLNKTTLPPKPPKKPKKPTPPPKLPPKTIKQPKSSKTPPKKPIIVPKPPKRVVKKPKKIIIPPIPKIDKNKVNFKNKLGLIKYKEGNKVKTIRTGLPYYQALRVAAATVDKTLRASMSVEAYGKTKKKVSKPSLRKFRLKKGKNPLVQKLVEYKKYRLDSKGETSKLKATSLLKKEISKYKKRGKK